MKNISDREKIPEMYLSGLSARQIGKIVGLSGGAVHSILNVRGVPRRNPREAKIKQLAEAMQERARLRAEIKANKPTPIPRPLTGFRAKLADKEWLKLQMRHASDYTIAAEIGCTEGTVRYAIRRHGLVRPQDVFDPSINEIRLLAMDEYHASGGSDMAGFGMLGRKQTEHQRNIARLANKGNTVNLGSKRTPEQRARMSAAAMGKPGTNLGRKFTDEHKEKIRQANLGKHTSDSTKAKIREARSRQSLMTSGTKPELLMEEELRRRGMPFETHKAMVGIPDIFIEPNVCVFVDGDYWHNTPVAKAHDKQINKELKKLGFQVVRFWEHEIKANVAACVDRLTKRYTASV